MKNLYLLSLCIISLFYLSCGSDDSSNSSSSSSGSLKQIDGGKYAGGVFKMNEVENFKSLYPLNITEVSSSRIGNQLYEGLCIFNQKTLEIEPALAESWEVNENATEFTFKLRKGVFFHDDPCFKDGKGREVNIEDVKYVFMQAATADINNQGYHFYLNRIKGFKEYYESTQKNKPLAEGITGVEVLDESHIKITLNDPFGSFLNLLALPFVSIYPKEAVDKYGTDMRINAVGTGPFYLKKIIEDEAVFLTKFDKYWGKDKAGNQLPYLDGVKVTFIKEHQSQLLEFRKGNIDMIFRIPLEMADEIISPDGKLTESYSEFSLQENASFTIQYYGFYNQRKPFQDKRVRQAFNLAVDRDKLTKYTLKGSAAPGDYGIVPPGFDGYEYDKLNGFKFNPVKARELLAAAGYGNGEGFGVTTLQINSGGGRNEQVAEAIQSMLLENLNLEVKLKILPFAQHLENIETGQVDFWRAGWIADYPDPENFLNLLWSIHIPEEGQKSYLNSFRFDNKEFDKYFTQALKTIDRGKRYELYRKAENIMLEEAPMMVLFYDTDQRLLQSKIRNFPQNAMEYRNFRDVYFVPE